MQKLVTGFLVALGLLAGVVLAQQKRPQDVDLQAAIRKESIDGDLNGAIKMYKAIAAKYKSDRAVTAQALVQMAGCYQKLGDAQARTIFEQVVRDYADQKGAVATARARLGANDTRKTSALVWSGPDADDGGGVFPDGRYISYVDWDTGDLALHEIATGENRHITDTKQKKGEHQKVFGEESAISRDGKLAAYSWYDEDNGKRFELRVASLTGDPNPHRLYDNPAASWLEPTDWSPDGKWVAVQLELKDGNQQIGLISVSDGTVRVLRSGKFQGDSHVYFSPDGKHIAYDLSEGDAGLERALFVTPLEGSPEMPAAPHRGRNVMVGWSPDGTRLVFASDRTGTMALWSLGFIGGKPQGEPELIKADLGDVFPMRMTASGAFYYGVRSGGGSSRVQIGSFDFSTGKLGSPPRDVTQDYYLESNSTPQWPADGRFLAYVSRYGRTRMSLAIRSAETFELVREAQPKLFNYRLSGWAPDGNSLLAIGADSDAGRGVFRIDVHTGNVSLLVSVPNSLSGRIERAVWSPDGNSLFLKRTNPDKQESAFLQRDPGTGVEKDLVRRPWLGDLNANSFSPDGRYIMTASNDASANTRFMLLIPLDGGEPRVIMPVAAETKPEDLNDYNKGQAVNGVYWMPDGRSFLVAKRPTGKKEREVWQVPVDGSAPHKLDWTIIDGKFPWGMLRTGGRDLAMAASEPAPKQSLEIWVLDHFLPAQAAK